jgi:hypothetical protein
VHLVNANRTRYNRLCAYRSRGVGSDFLKTWIISTSAELSRTRIRSSGEGCVQKIHPSVPFSVVDCLQWSGSLPCGFVCLKLFIRFTEPCPCLVCSTFSHRLIISSDATGVLFTKVVYRHNEMLNKLIKFMNFATKLACLYIQLSD